MIVQEKAEIVQIYDRTSFRHNGTRFKNETNMYTIFFLMFGWWKDTELVAPPHIAMMGHMF